MNYPDILRYRKDHEWLSLESESQPELVNTDPYGEGWMIKMKVDNPDDISKLMDTAAYTALVG